MAFAPSKDYSKAVAFVFLADWKGDMLTKDGAPVPNGTGFFVGVHNPEKTQTWGYLVTAKHVLLNEKGFIYNRIYLRINNTTGGSGFGAVNLATSGPNKTVFLHTDPTVDIAVIPIVLDPKLFDYKFLSIEMIKSKEDFKKSTISSGSDVFFIGLFAPHVGDKANAPIYRFGRVAMITDDRIRWHESFEKPPEMVELFLLETMSFGGNSGSPVFFSQGMDRFPGVITIGSDEITLAGVMRGSFNEPRPGDLIQTPNVVRPIIAQNIGIAAVTPAYLLREILFSDELVKIRASNPFIPPAVK